MIGAGVTGLAAAHRLCEKAPEAEVRVFDASPTAGGVLQTEQRDDFLIERSADSFITNVPWGLDLCRRLGLEDELLHTDDAHRRAFIVRRGKLVPTPEGFMLMSPRRLWPILSTPLLGPGGKIRLLAEYFIPARKSQQDESLASFATRRLGRQAFERLVQPLVAGIYTADAEKLSVSAALPRFVEMEHQYGGLIRAALRERRRQAANGDQSGARYSLFLAPRRGMTQLVEALVARLPAGSLRLQTPVQEVAPDPAGGWSLRLPDGTETFAAVVVAAPAHCAASLLAGVDSQLAEPLRGIPYASSAVVSLGYRRDKIAHPLNGFGFVVPAIEQRPILAGSFSSVKFAGRAPADHVLIRVFLGGAGHEDLVDLDDDALRELASGELRDLLGARGEPVVSLVCRWREAMPQYHLGHAQRVARIDERLATHAGLEVAGNAYHGVGVPNCVHSGEQAAQRILQKLRPAPND